MSDLVITMENGTIEIVYYLIEYNEKAALPVKDA
jgi:hypothetical protein